MDDRDLDDAALWAAVDTAAEASRRAPPLLPKPPSPAIRVPDDDDHRGEVLQPARPFKVPRLASPATPPPPSPLPSPPPPFMTPDASRRLVVVESPAPHGCLPGHGLFPSVSLANFKKYQEIALSILEKSDYTLIGGNPYIKKSGWRKISCFFNISFEIKDRSIEFDDRRNVNRAEFLVRASMQSGRFSDGWGSCDQREKRFNKPNHDIPSTAETRAKNKACQPRSFIDMMVLCDLRLLTLGIFSVLEIIVRDETLKNVGASFDSDNPGKLKTVTVSQKCLVLD